MSSYRGSYRKLETWRCLTFMKPDSKNFDKRNVDEMLVKQLFIVALLYVANYFEALILLGGFTLKD